jgi:flavodoxin|tara:strand:+ start:10427 stop:10906 length:480 start_codon:yes stop_codon:yes gene_type:complete
MEKTVLVIYYSDTGNTEKVARHIANETGAVVEAIHTPVFGKGIWNYLKRAWYALSKKVIPINDIENDPSQFDLVIIGSPVWAGHVASPVRSYLMKYSSKFSSIAFFVTLGGSGGESALQDMKDLSDLEPEVELIINQKDFRADDASIKTRRYASYLINR